MIRTSYSRLLELFSSLGLRSGEKVMIHSALFSLGLIEGGINGFFQALRETIGVDGTLIVPTFTYSFRRGEVFDILNTPSANNIGVFSEFVRNQPSSIRSLDPLFSMVALGPQADELMKRSSYNCFGENSVYNTLFETDVLFVAIGITYSTGLAGFMHLEKLANVPYREDLPLSGVSRGLDGVDYNDQAIHFARKEKMYKETIINREPMGKLLEGIGVSHALSYGYGRHISLRGHKWQNAVLTELKKNPLFMLEKNQYPRG